MHGAIKKALAGGVVTALATAGSVALAASGGITMDDVNMSPGATALGQEIFGLHMTIFWICFATFLEHV